MRLEALLTNRLYHVGVEAKHIAEKIKSESKRGNYSEKLRRRPNGDLEIDVPKKLDWKLLKYKLCACFRHKGNFSHYK